MSRTRNGVKWLDRADRADRLAQRAGKVPARQPGDGKLTAVEDAPGSYLKVRASE
jgi:polyhydroxyalkanoate synthase